MEKVYLLLRNNIESGPFTFAQLQKQSLLSTDLIWIEGESTGWLSPGEITAIQLRKEEVVPVQPVGALVPGPTKVPPPPPAYPRPIPTLKSFPERVSHSENRPKNIPVPQETTIFNDGDLIDFRVHKKGRKMVSLDQLAAVAFIALVVSTAWYGRHQFFAGEQPSLSAVAPVAFVSEESFAAKDQSITPAPISAIQDTVLSSSPVSTGIRAVNKTKTYTASVAVTREEEVQPEPAVKNEIAPAPEAIEPKKQKEPQPEMIAPHKEAPKTTVTESAAPKREEMITPTSTEESAEAKKKKSLGQAIKGIFKKKKNAEESPEEEQ